MLDIKGTLRGTWFNSPISFVTRLRPEKGSDTLDELEVKARTRTPVLPFPPSLCQDAMGPE